MSNKLFITKIKYNKIFFDKKKAKKHLKKNKYKYLTYYDKKLYIVFIISNEKYENYMRFETIEGIIYKYGHN